MNIQYIGPKNTQYHNTAFAVKSRIILCMDFTIKCLAYILLTIEINYALSSYNGKTLRGRSL